MSLLTPVLPFILWSTREVRQQREAADTESDPRKVLGDQLWGQVMQHALDDGAVQVQAREFQDEIFQRRRKSPLKCSYWFYYLFRMRFETQMQFSGEDMVTEAQSKGW